LLSAIIFCRAQQSYNITFLHDNKVVYGTFTTPSGSGPFPTIIINPGSGAIDRDGTIPFVGGNVACLYPNLLNDTLKIYKELGDALVDSGYAVLRYDKLEYTYPTTLGTITFDKVWLPVESAIDYIKTRSDVDTTKIILIGHSEGSSIIPFIANGRNDVKALISIAGSRTPLDSLLAYQLVYIARTCNGDTAAAQAQANQILSYFNVIRTNAWNTNTPSLFGAPASAWYDYIRAVDSVSINYNIDHLPTLFTGMGQDIEVPPSELIRLQNEVTITGDFWSIPGLIHYMTPNNDPHVSPVLTDTIIYWLRQHVLVTGVNSISARNFFVQIKPNPFVSSFSVLINEGEIKNLDIRLTNTLGQLITEQEYKSPAANDILIFNENSIPSGVYFLNILADGEFISREIIKE